jgi:hypothetical protein
MLAADLQETAYSVLRPPKTTATRMARVDRTSEVFCMSETPVGEAGGGDQRVRDGERPPVSVTHSAASHTHHIEQGHRKHAGTVPARYKYLRPI